MEKAGLSLHTHPSTENERRLHLTDMAPAGAESAPDPYDQS